MWKRCGVFFKISVLLLESVYEEEKGVDTVKLRGEEQMQPGLVLIREEVESIFS